MYVYHVDDMEIVDVIEGLVYRIPPKKIVEIKNDFHARLLLDHKHFHGIIEVKMVPSEDGFKWNEDFKTRAAAALEEKDNERVGNWVTDQIEERIRKNYPALPPDARTKQIIARRGIDIGQFGIHPVEIKKGQSPTAPAAESVNVVDIIQDRNALLDQNKQLVLDREADRKRMERMEAAIAALSAKNNTAKDGGEGDETVDGGEQHNEGSNQGGANTASGDAGEVGEANNGTNDEDSGVSTAPDPTLQPIRRPNSRTPRTR